MKSIFAILTLGFCLTAASPLVLEQSGTASHSSQRAALTSILSQEMMDQIHKPYVSIVAPQNGEEMRARNITPPMSRIAENKNPFAGITKITICEDQMTRVYPNCNHDCLAAWERAGPCIEGTNRFAGWQCNKARAALPKCYKVCRTNMERVIDFCAKN